MSQEQVISFLMEQKKPVSASQIAQGIEINIHAVFVSLRLNFILMMLYRKYAGRNCT